MLRLRDGQGTLWDEFLPAEIRVLSDELATVDALLDVDAFLAPFARHLSCTVGRPTIPMETYLRLMYLKHRYSLGYETLVKEVSDSLSWRRFCRIRLDDVAPHPTTLMKLTRRCGVEVVEELNAAVLRTAVERKLLRSHRIRVDTTAMEADVRYPTDSGLCAHSVSRVARAVAKVKSVGLATRTRFRSRRGTAGKLVRRVSHALSGAPRDRRAAIDKLTAELREVGAATVRQAEAVLRNAKRGLRRTRRRGAHLVRNLERDLELARRILAQTARRLAGETAIHDRLVSMSDPDARPIRRGKPQAPNEFGFKVSIADTPEGFVVSHQVYVGNPADAQTLEAAVVAAQRAGMKVKTVLADRGYGDAVGDQALAACGIADSVIPRKGKALPHQSTRSWRRRYRWRAGAEGRISALKRQHGMRRTRLKGYQGAQIWAGLGVLGSNIDRIAAFG